MISETTTPGRPAEGGARWPRRGFLARALGLEYLEAEFYTYAVTGSGLAALGIPGTSASNITIKANPAIPFATPVIQQLAMELATDEQKHILDIQNLLTSLGASYIPEPPIDLYNSFNAAAAAGLPTPFDPFAGEDNFLLGAYIFEDVGVTAYHGASPLISSPTVLGYAAGIYAVEGYHASAIRILLDQLGMATATEAISGLRQMASGVADYGVDRGPLDSGPAGHTSIVLADSNALAFARNFRQVLNIAYLAPDAGASPTSGGFFPAGVNGTIQG